MNSSTVPWFATAPCRVAAWFPEPQAYFDFCAKRVAFDGLWVEMGTGTGGTAKKIINVMPPERRLHTFDCFKGLPENWHHYKKGTFAQEPPKLDPRRAQIWHGYFEDTLPEFTKEHSENIAFLHIDCDLYSSTKTIFHHLRDQIVPGTIIVFDEIHGHPSFEEGEWRAFVDYARENDIYFCFFARLDSPVTGATGERIHMVGNQAACEILPHPKVIFDAKQQTNNEKTQGE
jgi:predicted O-methyltransferase YrrM